MRNSKLISLLSLLSLHVCFALAIASCQSSEKKVSAEPDRTSNGKLTRAKPGYGEVQLRVRAGVLKQWSVHLHSVQKYFDENASVFGPCMEISKDSLFSVKALWEVVPGVYPGALGLNSSRILKVTPLDDPAVKECFLKQIKELRIPLGWEGLKGSMTVEATLGPPQAEGIQQ